MAICILNLTMIDLFPDLQDTAKFCDLLYITVYSVLPSGNLLHSYWKKTKNIVDLPIEDGDVPVCYVSLPESTSISKWK